MSENSNIIRTGYMKKIKTGRRKWFVLRKETPDAQSRLEYYDSEKKYQGGAAPRKVILLKTCFNINQLSDNKHKNVIALYTKDECLTLAVDDETEADEWFKDLLLMQQGEDLPEGEVLKPTFAHVWEVVLVNRGLGTQDLIGNYRLCLREKTLSLVRKDCDYPQIELNLSSIRSCGSLLKYVFFEVGRSCALGAGELWMLTEDHTIAQNVHSTVYHAMTKNSSKDEFGPKSRIRSSSATETSKPNHKKPYSKSHIFPQGLTSGGRERCDSMPSRARTASEGNHPIPMFPSLRGHLAPHRQCSIHRDLGSSPPIGSPISPPSAAASTDSAGSSYSLADENEDLDSNHGRYGHSLTPDEAIAEEDIDSLCVPYGISPTTGNYVPMAPPSSDDGYVDMSPKGRHGNITPAASLSSITSGTPSTDMRFAEYQLDKVMSFFPPSSDDESRPIRAYSVGSRPETHKYKKHLMDVHSMESRRDRAASVGSKTKKGPIRVLPPHGHYPSTHPKSSSAPLLSSTTRIPGSSSSMGSEMDDLMELDFTNIKKRSFDGYLEMKPSCTRSNTITPATTPVSTSSGYVEMKPGVTPPSMSNNGYMEMKPGTSPSRNEYAYMDLSKNHHARNDYVDMNAKNTTKKASSNNNNNNNNNNNPFSEYAEMNHHHHLHHHQPTIKRSLSQISPSSSSNHFHRNSPNLDYIDMHFNNRMRTDSDKSEGYVEMSLGKGHHRQSSLDNNALSNDDKKPCKKDKNRSLPIAILNTNQNRFSLEISPKMQLPLTNTTTTTSPSSSLPSGRKNSNYRRDSKDSSSSSVTTTPSNCSAIFPLSLNSPSSPVKPLKTPDKSPGLLLNSLYKRIRGKSGNNENNDYAVMDFQKNNNSNNKDYINLDFTKVSLEEEEKVSDYAEMSTNETPDSFLSLTESSSEGFKPISEVSPKSNEENVAKCEKRDSLNDTRPGSASSDLCSSTSTLVGSRPDSVNSDLINSARPSSAASLLHYANLDLQAIDDDGEASKSPRTVRNNSSDSSQEVSFNYAEIDFNKSEGFKRAVKN